MMKILQFRMCRYFLYIYFLYFSISPSIGNAAHLVWNGNTEDDVEGYKVYCGTLSEYYHRIDNVGNNTNYNLSKLFLYEDETYYITITAYDGAGNESGFSDELRVTLNDEISYFEDNCPDIYNPDQEDNYPPGGNNIGNACECEGDFDCDGDVDGVDSALFKKNLGRNNFFNSCTDSDNPCEGDFDCDGDVDGVDSVVFKEDLGRNLSYNQCPDCVYRTEPGSCVGNCDEQTPTGCWCDEACLKEGDCCPDACAVCGYCL